MNSSPGGLMFIAALTSTPSAQLSAWLQSINIEAIYSMVIAIAMLWLASYVGTAIAMHYVKRYEERKAVY